MKKFFETNLSRNRCVQSVCIKGSISSKNVSAIIRFSRPHDVSLAVLKSGLPSKNIEEGGDGGSCPFSFSRQLSSYRADVVISCKENRLPRWNRKKKISRLKKSKEIQELFVYDIIFFIDRFESLYLSISRRNIDTFAVHFHYYFQGAIFRFYKEHQDLTNDSWDDFKQLFPSWKVSFFLS